MVAADAEVEASVKEYAGAKIEVEAATTAAEKQLSKDIATTKAAARAKGVAEAKRKANLYTVKRAQKELKVAKAKLMQAGNAVATAEAKFESASAQQWKAAKAHALVDGKAQGVQAAEESAASEKSVDEQELQQATNDVATAQTFVVATKAAVLARQKEAASQSAALEAARTKTSDVERKLDQAQVDLTAAQTAASMAFALTDGQHESESQAREEAAEADAKAAGLAKESFELGSKIKANAAYERGLHHEAMKVIALPAKAMELTKQGFMGKTKVVKTMGLVESEAKKMPRKQQIPDFAASEEDLAQAKEIENFERENKDAVDDE